MRRRKFLLGSGFPAADVGRHALAQRYFIQALDLAMAAGDRLRNGRPAVALARAGLAVALTSRCLPGSLDAVSGQLGLHDHYLGSKSRAWRG